VHKPVGLSLVGPRDAAGQPPRHPGLRHAIFGRGWTLGLWLEGPYIRVPPGAIGSRWKTSGLVIGSPRREEN
jgi:hypothetical protein